MQTGSVAPQWRRFHFFEKEGVRLSDQSSSDGGYGGPEPAFGADFGAPGGNAAGGAGILDNIVVTCASSTRSWLVLGDADGYINLFDRRLSLLGAFPAYPRAVSHVVALFSGVDHIVVTCGDDEAEAIDPTVKIWKLSKGLFVVCCLLRCSPSLALPPRSSSFCCC
jgi:hypothetical protein